MKKKSKDYSKKSVEEIRAEMLRREAEVKKQRVIERRKKEEADRRAVVDRREMPREKSSQRLDTRRYYTVSQEEIAKALGVHRTLVTKVLSGNDDGISNRTRARIFEKIEELGMHIEKRAPKSERIAVHLPVTFSMTLSGSGKIFSQGTGVITNLSYGGCRIKPDTEDITIPVAPCTVDILFKMPDGKNRSDGIFGIPMVRADASGTFGVQITGYLGNGCAWLREYLAAEGITPPSAPVLVQRKK